MSWDKNTLFLSKVDVVVGILKALKYPYTMTTLGTVSGRGLNDKDGDLYQIRKLNFDEHVILEQMVRTCDCDSDDIIRSEGFTLNTEPKSWQLEKNECVCKSCKEEQIN